jgi:hypothetical protein
MFSSVLGCGDVVHDPPAQRSVVLRKTEPTFGREPPSPVRLTASSPDVHHVHPGPRPGAVPVFRPARFPGPLPEPAVRLRPQRALSKPLWGSNSRSGPAARGEEPPTSQRSVATSSAATAPPRADHSVPDLDQQRIRRRAVRDLLRRPYRHHRRRRASRRRPGAPRTPRRLHSRPRRRWHRMARRSRPVRSRPVPPARQESICWVLGPGSRQRSCRPSRRPSPPPAPSPGWVRPWTPPDAPSTTNVAWLTPAGTVQVCSPPVQAMVSVTRGAWALLAKVRRRPPHG